MASSEQRVIPMDGTLTHLVRSIQLGSTTTKCGLRIHGISVESGESLLPDCGKCFRQKTVKVAKVSTKCSDCGEPTSHKSGVCSICREFNQFCK